MEALLENLQCCIHLDVLEEPVTLPCGHNVCLQCAKSLINNKTLKCPLDQKVHLLPYGENSLSVNWALNGLIHSMKTTSSNPEIESTKKGIIDTFASSNQILEITKITPINNEILNKKFNKKKGSLSALGRMTNDLIKYHGTSLDAENKIKTSGFKLPKDFSRNSCAEGSLNFGKAIYLSSYSSKAVSYCYDKQVIVVCKVLLGRVLEQNNSILDLTPEKVHYSGYDSIYCPHTLEHSEINKGSENDEYAIYDSDQILPLYIVEFKEGDIFESQEFSEYNPKLSAEETNFDLLFKLLKNGTQTQKKNILLTFGNLCRDYNSVLTKIVIKYHKELFQMISEFLSSKQETLILPAGRVIWNCSFNNKYIQKLTLDYIPEKIFLNLLVRFSSFQDIQERIAGVLANLSQLEEENSVKIAKRPEFIHLFSIALESCKKNKVMLCVNVLKTIANVFEHDKSWSHKVDDLNDLLDCEVEEINIQATRIFSNIIGYTKEWLINGYKPTMGLNKI